MGDFFAELRRRNASDLGQWFHGDLPEAEFRYLMAEEWAVTAMNILWRRSKLALWFGPQDVSALKEFLVKMRCDSEPGTGHQSGKS
jgi:glycerol-3-phosphate dehydrogenase